MKKIIALFLVFSIIGLYGNLYAKERRGADLKVQKKTGQQIRGELIAVKVDSLLLKESVSGADMTVDAGDITVITIVKKSKAFIGAGLALLISGGAGFLYGYSSYCSECHKYFCTSNGYLYGAIGAGAGVLIGAIAGFAAGKDKTLKIQGKSEARIQKTMGKLRQKSRVPDFQ